jgi:iron(II)-dependent oxidoreductase
VDSLAADLIALRRRTLALTGDLTDAQWAVPRLPIVNPIGWELGHVGWFQERWILREALGRPPIRADGDSLWDSSAVAHATRWDLPLPDRARTLAFLEEVLDRSVAALAAGASPELRYHARYTLMHECMHAEALAYMRQTLALPAPPASKADPGGGALPGDVDVPGGEHRLGAERGAEWVFDNETWAHPVRVEAFRIARAQVTQGEFAAFVADKGYQRRELWHRAAPVWEGPAYWRDGRRRDFDREVAIEPNRPISHVSWYEADAFCRWAGRRLPTEAEWDRAAVGAGRGNLDGAQAGTVDVGAFPGSDSDCGCRQMVGNTWEWTASAFEPFPGFTPDPYEDYSAPWFGTRKVLRGGAWATSSLLASTKYRNFFAPDRRDVIAGFRTCAPA